MNQDEFDVMWKLKSVELAMIEMTQLDGDVDFSKLFDRSKMIYNTGHKHNISKWKNVWEGGEEVLEEKRELPPQYNKPQVVAKSGFKICPKCGQEVPETWASHDYKKDGSECGHKFE